MQTSKWMCQDNFRFKEDSRNKPKHIQRMVRKLDPFTRTEHNASIAVV